MADVDGVVADTRTLTEILDELLTAADTRSQAEWTTVDVGALVEEVAGAATAAAEKSGVTADGRPATGAGGAGRGLTRLVAPGAHGAGGQRREPCELRGHDLGADVRAPGARSR